MTKSTSQTIKTRKVWVVLTPEGTPLLDTVDKTEDFSTCSASFHHAFMRGGWKQMRAGGHRVVRADLRYPVKGKERKG